MNQVRDTLWERLQSQQLNQSVWGVNLCPLYSGIGHLMSETEKEENIKSSLSENSQSQYAKS